MKLLFDESLSPRLVALLRALCLESESALRNGLACTGDRRILDYAATHGFIPISTDSDFERLASSFLRLSNRYRHPSLTHSSARARRPLPVRSPNRRSDSKLLGSGRGRER